MHIFFKYHAKYQRSSDTVCLSPSTFAFVADSHVLPLWYPILHDNMDIIHTFSNVCIKTYKHLVNISVLCIMTYVAMSGTLTSSHHLGNDYFCTLQFPGLSYSVFLPWQRGDSNYLVVTIKKISHTCTWSWQCSVHILYTHIHMCTIPASKARNCCMKSIRSRIMPSICNDPLNKKVACTNVVPVAQYYTHYLASSVIVRLCFGLFYCCLHRVFSHFLHHLFVSTRAINCSEMCVLTCLY